MASLAPITWYLNTFLRWNYTRLLGDLEGLQDWGRKSARWNCNLLQFQKVRMLERRRERGREGCKIPCGRAINAQNGNNLCNRITIVLNSTLNLKKRRRIITDINNWINKWGVGTALPDREFQLINVDRIREIENHH